MQLFGLHKNLYKLSNYACTQELLDNNALKRKKIFDNWELLKSRKVPDQDIALVTKISRATYYRRKKLVKRLGVKGFLNRSKKPKTLRESKIPISVINLIIKLRKENPTYGKAKITIILKRDYQINYSESTIGRVISKLIRENKIQPSESYVRAKRKRKFNAHAKKWQHGMRSKSPGKMVQIDHMTVTKNNITMKHFRRC